MTETSKAYGLYHKKNGNLTVFKPHQNIVLSSLQINRCSCGEMTVSIPKIEELHKLLSEHPDATLVSYEENEWKIRHSQ